MTVEIELSTGKSTTNAKDGLRDTQERKEAPQKMREVDGGVVRQQVQSIPMSMSAGEDIAGKEGRRRRIVAMVRNTAVRMW